MTFTDIISKQTTPEPTESFQQSSLNDQMPKKHRKNQKIKKLHASVLDLLHGHRSIEILENKNTSQQHAERLPSRPSIIKSSDVERVVSKKSVTFATIFDPVVNEDNEDDATLNTDTNPTSEMTSEQEDLVTVIVNRPFGDPTTNDAKETIEPYPFRSEISLSPESSLLSDVTPTSHHTRKGIIHRFIPQHRPKKLRHPIQIIDPVNKMNRAGSTPNLVISSPLSLPSTIMTTTHDQQSPVKTIRTWFQLSTVGRFVRSFGKNSPEHPNDSKTKTKSHGGQSADFAQFSEVIY